MIVRWHWFWFIVCKGHGGNLRHNNYFPSISRNLMLLLINWNCPGSEPDFFLSKITGPRWLELPIARTDFDSPFEFKPAKFYCNYIRSDLIGSMSKFIGNKISHTIYNKITLNYNDSKFINNYSRTSLAWTRRDCQNLFELSVVRATEVP
jgi:hypothetical protein